MSRLEIELMDREDVPEIVKGWNETYVFDRVSEERFEEVIFDDPNYQPEGTLGLIDEDGIMGFASCVARDGVLGKDGKGKKEERFNGYLKGIFYENESIGRVLLERTEEFLRSRDKNIIKVVEYGGGRYFFPGIDLRYKSLIEFFEQNGFEETRQLQDVSLDLENYYPGQEDYQKEKWERVGDEGIEIVPYHSSMLSQMQEFVPRLNQPHWFPEGWEKDWEEKENAVVAIKGNRILGYACYHPNPSGTGGFGTIGTLPSERGKGIGTCMMDECMKKLKEAGTKEVVAGWANTPFYLRSGWEVHREYAVFEKSLKAKNERES